MRVDVSESRYREADNIREEFSPHEIRRAKVLLRRLHFLESRVEENGGIGAASGSGGAAFAEWEMEALEWVLDEIGFLAERGDRA